MEKILTGICGKTEFWKDNQQGVTFYGLFHQGDGLLGIKGWIGHSDLRDGHAGPDEIVVVEVEELFSHLINSPCRLVFSM